MSRRRKQLPRFLQAEEVPRWFGISVVLIYLGGLAGVAKVGIESANEDRDQLYNRSTEQALGVLADRLGSTDPTGPVVIQRVLRRFAASSPFVALRVLDPHRTIVASIAASEIGTLSPVPTTGSISPRRLEVVDLPPEADSTVMRVLRAPIRRGVTLSGEYIEAVYPRGAPGASGLSEQAGTLMIVLCACGALFVVYRRLRRHMRGVAQIARQLEHHGTHIEEQLGALRVADSAGALGDQWNQLIDTVETLQSEVKRTTATRELSRALANSSGGALAAAMNTAPNGVVHVDAGGRIEYANAAARRLLGLGAEAKDSESVDALDAAGPSASLVEVVRSAWGADGAIEPRDEIREVAGDAGSYRVRVLPLHGGSAGGGCLVLIDDVSQQVRVEKAREDFVSQVTHELRTPLTNIRAYAETLSSGMFDDPKVVTECYNVITKETRRLSRLIDDILNVSQMEVGAIQLDVNDVDLRTLLTESVRDVRGLADEKNIDLRLTLPNKLEPVRGDRDKLAVVINNLLGNALKYTPAEGSVVVGCQVTGNEALVTVKDNGIGIAEEDRQRVFEKFQRGHDPEVQNQTGTGVGLYTAREIARRHGGDVELMSEEGNGSTFIVRLPHVPSRAGVMSTT